MIPDILGYNLEDGIKLLNRSGVKIDNIIIEEYTSPMQDIIGNDIRILKVKDCFGKITLIVSNF